jgi:hypothetical protein
MATRIVDTTVPSEFIRLDDTVTDPDAYVNVRDMQVVRDNHNILIARMLKRQIFTWIGIEDGSTYGRSYLNLMTVKPASRESGDVMMTIPLFVTPFTKELEIILYAQRWTNTVDCKLYPVLDGAGISGEISTSYEFDVTAVAFAKYSVSLPVHEKIAQAGTCTLNLYMAGIMYGAALSAVDSDVNDVGPSWVDVDDSAGGAGVITDNVACYDTSDTEIPPRLYVGSVGLTGALKRVYVDSPWDKFPNVGATKFNQKAVQACTIQSMSIYEKSVSSFATQVEVP